MVIEKRKRGRPFKTGEARTVLRTLRIPPSLDERIMKSAQDGKRSFSDEVILRIEQALAGEAERDQEIASLLAEAISGRGGPEAAKRLAELWQRQRARMDKLGLWVEAMNPIEAALRSATRSDVTPAPEENAAQAPIKERRRSKK